MHNFSFFCPSPSTLKRLEMFGFSVAQDGSKVMRNGIPGYVELRGQCKRSIVSFSDEAPIEHFQKCFLSAQPTKEKAAGKEAPSRKSLEELVSRWA